ncbi:MAG TPA: tetratricopeptide repeat protein [Dissulfurispiraceae bacterium]|nr:tetratricopeptide repeat protein [Dissulfurispiraceae bacterium]
MGSSSPLALKKVVCILSVVTMLIATGTRPVCADDGQLKSADDLYRARNYSAAEESYRNVFINHGKGPLSERALLGMAKSEDKLKRFDIARLNLERLLSAYPQSGYMNEAFFLLGYIFMYDHKMDQAEHYFELAGGPFKQLACIGRAEVALRDGNVAAAASLIGNVDKKDLEHNPRAIFVSAAIFSKRGMHKEAVNIISRVSDDTLKEEDLRADKALIYFNASRFDETEKLCKHIISDPVSKLEQQNARKILAGLYESKGRVDEALELFLEIVRYESDDSIKMSIAKLYDLKGETGNALRFLSLLKDRGIRSAEMEKRLKRLMASGNPEAVAYLSKFSSALSSDSRFIVPAARYLIENGKKMEGTLMLRRALKGTESGDAALSLAEVLFNDGKYGEAKKFTEPLLLENRYFLEATFLMSKILRREGDTAGAITCLEKAAKYSKDGRIDSKIADLYAESGDRTRALKYYKTASDRGGAIAALKAGDLLYLYGNVSQSRIYYKRALSLGLSDQKDLQWAFYQYGKMTGNKEYLKKAAQSGGIVGEAAGLLTGGE